MEDDLFDKEKTSTFIVEEDDFCQGCLSSVRTLHTIKAEFKRKEMVAQACARKKVCRGPPLLIPPIKHYHRSEFETDSKELFV
jgi:hypothetical protein